MQDALYQSAGSTGAPIHRGLMTRFMLKGCSYAVYGLLIAVDGLSNPVSFDSRFLTLPYLIGGLALVRSFCAALDAHYDFHAGVFALGLSTLAALA
ncbi:MAG: hypothetical protein ACPGSM_22260 [Thiolinea sp.]